MRQGLDPSRLSPLAFAALYAAFFALAAVPVLRAGMLPLVDYPNHLARMQLLASLPHDATLQRFYALAWRPIPDLAMDVIVPVLLSVMPLAAAGKLFVLLVFLVLTGGAAMLHRVVCGRWSAWPLLAFLVVYNRLLLWGMLNYLFGLGLAFLALAGAVALSRRGAAVRLAAGTAFAFLVFFAHLAAFGVYAVLWLGHEAGAVRRRWQGLGAAAPRLAVAAGPLLLPLAVMLLAGTSGGGGVGFGQPWRKLDLLFSVFDLYHRPFDVACFVLAVAGLGYLFACRFLAFAPALLLPAALLGLAYLVMPTDLLGATGADRRLPLALALVLCAATVWAGPRPRLERAVLAAAAAMFLLRLGTVAASWQASDREYHTLLAGLDRIPRGSRVAVAFPPAAINVSATPLVHFAVLAAARRDAFVPTLFARPSQQPIVMQPAYRALAAATASDRLWDAFVVGAPPLDAADRATLARYDYIVFAGVRPFVLADRGGLVPVFQAPRFAVFRLAPARVGG
ncbi:MAG TPA: hypothetical protein VMU87_15335 [Stellaceae bacterium]|nr:hypothetical protein [Stellaceae bacterium]